MWKYLEKLPFFRVDLAGLARSQADTTGLGSTRLENDNFGMLQLGVVLGRDMNQTIVSSRYCGLQDEMI